MDYTEIRKGLEPVVDMFLGKLQIIDTKISNRQKDLDTLGDTLMAKERELMQFETRLRKEYADKAEELSFKKDEFDKAIRECETERNKTISLKNDMEIKCKKIDDVCAGLAADKKQAEGIVESNKTIENTLRLKLQSLETDFSKLDAKRGELADKENEFRQKVAVLDKREAELDAKQKELSDLEYNLKIAQKKIIADMKRRALE